MRFKLFQKLFFLLCDIFDKSMSRFILFLFLVKTIVLIFSPCLKSDLIITEPIALFLSQLFHLLPIPLFLFMIHYLEFGILTDYKRFRRINLLRHLDPVFERFLDIWLNLIHQPLELVGAAPVIIRLLIRQPLLPDELIKELLFFVNLLCLRCLLLALLVFRCTHIYLYPIIS